MAEKAIFVKHPEHGIGRYYGKGPLPGTVIVTWLSGEQAPVEKSELKFKRVTIDEKGNPCRKL